MEIAKYNIGPIKSIKPQASLYRNQWEIRRALYVFYALRNQKYAFLSKRVVMNSVIVFQNPTATIIRFPRPIKLRNRLHDETYNKTVRCTIYLIFPITTNVFDFNLL